MKRLVMLAGLLIATTLGGNAEDNIVGMQMVRHGSTAAEDPLTTLSPQERRVLELIAGGRTNKEVGVALGLTEKTVKNYLANVFAKLDVSRRSQAVALFVGGKRPGV